MNIDKRLVGSFLISCFLHGIIFLYKPPSTSPQYEFIVSPSALEVSLVSYRVVEVKKEETEEDKENEATEKDILLKKKVTQKSSEEKSQKDVEPNVSQGAMADAKPLTNLNKPPIYPYRARVRGYEGKVTLKVMVDSNGRVVDIVQLEGSGYSILDQAAQKAIKKWQFLPAKFLGVAVSSSVNIPVRFELN